MSEPAIQTRGLRKVYGTVEAVRGIDLDVPEGSVFALLGPNGAGKTTTVEILEGYRDRSDGEASVLGHDPQKNEPALKRRIGIVLQSTGVETYLTVAEAVELYRGYFPHPRPLDEIIEVVGLKEKRDERVKRLSGGQQRRLDVAIGLAGDPELLFLDEPTTGFDPAARRNAWDMVTNLKSLGKTVFLTTHYMDEAQYLADDVAIIVAGRIVARGSPSDLASRARGNTIKATIPSDAPPLPESLASAIGSNGREIEVVTEEPEKVLHELTGWSLEHDVRLQDLRAGGATLEDVYLELTKADGSSVIDE
jgi:ABC-2 type transport system ATP-binding protein